jgi:outer membrane protein
MRQIQAYFVALVVFGIGSASFASAEAKIATVDIQKILTSVDSGKKAKAELETFVNKRKAELQKEEGEIKKVVEEFQKQSMVMNEKARQKKEQELQARAMKFQEAVRNSQLEAQKKEQELITPILEKLRRMVKVTAPKKGYTVVLEKNASTVLYSLDQDDLTDEIVKGYSGFKDPT